jgi:hypothetical protein
MTSEDQEVAGQFSQSWRSEKNIPDVGVLRFNFLSEPSVNNAKRQLPDSLHSEMLSFLYAPPLLLSNPPGNLFSAKRGLEIPHSMKKTSILAANAGLKLNFDVSSRARHPERKNSSLRANTEL